MINQIAKANKLYLLKTILFAALENKSTSRMYLESRKKYVFKEKIPAVGVCAMEGREVRAQSQFGQWKDVAVNLPSLFYQEP